MNGKGGFATRLNASVIEMSIVRTVELQIKRRLTILCESFCSSACLTLYKNFALYVDQRHAIYSSIIKRDFAYERQRKHRHQQ